MTGWIQALIELGRTADADEALADYAAMLARWPEGPVPSRLGWLRGRLAEVRGEPRAAQALYAEALADPASAHLPFLHAQVLHTSGNLERALGHRREAIDRLTKAQQIFTQLRATPFLVRATADLAACGLRTRATDPLALTEREEDVVALVTRGFTNKEVAAELFLTAKTVEYHLGNVFAKLGIGSRRELRRLRTG